MTHLTLVSEQQRPCVAKTRVTFRVGVLLYGHRTEWSALHRLVRFDEEQVVGFTEVEYQMFSLLVRQAHEKQKEVMYEQIAASVFGRPLMPSSCRSCANGFALLFPCSCAFLLHFQSILPQEVPPLTAPLAVCALASCSTPDPVRVLWDGWLPGSEDDEPTLLCLELVLLLAGIRFLSVAVRRLCLHGSVAGRERAGALVAHVDCEVYR